VQVDVDGNVWAGVGDGVLVYAPDGELLGAISVGEVSNLAFAGDTLIMLQARPPLASG
jgi:gluconolactonase